MFKLFLLVVLISLVAAFIWQLKNYLARDNKLDELEAVRLESDLIDIDREIAEEKVRQQDVSSEIEEINSRNNKIKKESNNE
ncbi:MAG: hypothetical protein HN764_17760 [Gammaproteobacteria bacterium]|jgi:hypothetical protein|nr:hypothetical protein [Gammaproteobacteria bacterium]